METFVIFLKNDIRIIFRDKTLLLMFFLPVILILVCKFLVPFIAGFIPELDTYYWMILSAFCVLSGSTPAFLTAFLMLDEKDENLIPALRVIPLPYTTFVAYRILFLMISSFLFSNLFLIFNGLILYSAIKIILTSILVSFIPAVLLMLLLPFAKNKIEGVSLFKLINIVLFIPLVSFFLSSGWKFLFEIIPFYWVYEILEKNNDNGLLFSFLLGLVVNILYFYLLLLLFKKKYFGE